MGGNVGQMSHPLATGECFVPYQPPDCLETVGESLGWQFGLLQICWALAWSLTLFYMVIGNFARGFQQTSFISFFATMGSFIQVVRSYNPLGYRVDDFAADYFLTLFAGVLVGFSIIELAFLLLSMLSLQPIHLPPTPSWWDRLVYSLSLSTPQQIWRISIHLTLWIPLLASPFLSTIGGKDAASLVSGSVVALAVIALLVQVVIAREKLLAVQRRMGSPGLSVAQKKAAAQSSKLLKLFASCSFILVVWYPLLLIKLLTRMTGPDAHYGRWIMTARCDIACVLLAAIFDVVLLADILIIYSFFVRQAVSKDSELLTTGSVVASPSSTENI